jgi:UDP-glucuronate decarboxylase
MRARKSQKTCVVAGGAGFVGSTLCDALLSEGYSVICIDNFHTGREINLKHLRNEPRFTVVNADVIDAPPANYLGRLDRIYNLACAASPPHYQASPEHTLLSSVLGTRNLLALAQAAGARFLLASTSEIYGDPQRHPQRESYWGYVNPTGPRACYDEGKRAAETLTFDYARAGRGETRVARIFNTYGPRMRADDGRVVSNVVTQALSGDDITVYGHGDQTRSFCYVDDLVEGLMRLMEYDGSYAGAVNLGNPKELTVKDLVARVLRLTGSQSRVAHRPLPTDDPRKRRPDISLARRLLDWSPAVSLEEGLKKTISYFAQEAAAAASFPSSSEHSSKRRPLRRYASSAASQVKGAPVPMAERSVAAS